MDLTKIKQWLILGNGEQLPSVQHTDGTCSWILRHPSFVEWTLSEDCPVLWIQGCGKSVMTGYLQEHLTTGESKTLLYRFQRSASSTQSTPVTFTTFLIYHLLENWTKPCLDNGIYDKLQRLRTQFPIGPQKCPFKALWAVAASLLQTFERQFNLIIDAMDECLFDDSGLPTVSVFLETLSKLTRETRNKAIIFSRPEPMFIVAVESSLSIFMTKDLLLPDIMTFARRRYEELNLPNSEMNATLELVRSSSHGSFRWADLFLHHLGQSIQVTDFQTRMHNLPPSLGELYRNPDELECQRGLTIEIADIFLLQENRADAIISKLCTPLAIREFFEQYHQANDNTLGISFFDSHSFLAEKCLACLSNRRYADLSHIGSFLVANHDEKARVDYDARPPANSFYDYAYRFWDYHLIQTQNPSKSLLQQANEFLKSLQFTYWSQCSQRDCGQLVRVLGALSLEDQKLIELDKYFERPYSLLSTALESRKGDGFYFIVTRPKEATAVREEVFVGLQSLLGSRHHLTLQAKADVAYSRLYAGKMRVSRRIYAEVVDIQREVLGEHSSLFLNTLNFMAATITWTKASAGLLAVLGPDSWQYLSAQLWYARGATYLGQLDLALQILQSVAQKRRELFGAGDKFLSAVQMNVGEIQLLLGQHKESIATLLHVLKQRREAYPIMHGFRLDAEITLATAYQTAGMNDMALTIIHEIEEGVCDLKSQFQRYCQVTHLKGLLLVEGGSLNEAIHLLHSTVIQAEEDQFNRALLWIRLDLATLLRRRDIECDRAEASILFDNIVKDISGDNEPGFPDEPDPPRLLAAAERVLRLVKSRKYAEARQELESECLDWRRPSDFWLWVGGSCYKDLLQTL
ncbi:hypothetical protein F4777DRAFT_591564 [Nemania sp. FL0916]|nr:hypothetical protein F4777DRAFT_591564 [Nemania sp. FL0916]